MNIELGDLKPGAYRLLSKKEYSRLMETLKKSSSLSYKDRDKHSKGREDNRSHNKDVKPYDKDRKSYNKDVKPYDKDNKSHSKAANPHNKDNKFRNKETKSYTKNTKPRANGGRPIKRSRIKTGK